MNNKNLPNFLIVGAQKCGTTSLHDILSQHPQIFMSKVKEINYFINPHKYKKGLPFYSKHFRNSEGHLATGESSPGYICYPNVAQTIKEDLGDIKIVILLRDPIKRALSQYWDNRRHLSETETISEAISNHLSDKYSPQKKGYFSRGVYEKDVKKYIELFGNKNVHIIIFEDLLYSQTNELKRLYKFLGVDKSLGLQKLPKPSNSSQIWNNIIYTYFLKHPKYNKYLNKYLRRFIFFGKKLNYKYPTLKKEDLLILKHFYREKNQELEKLIGVKLDKWQN